MQSLNNNKKKQESVVTIILNQKCTLIHTTSYHGNPRYYLKLGLIPLLIYINISTFVIMTATLEFESRPNIKEKALSQAVLKLKWKLLPPNTILIAFVL